MYITFIHVACRKTNQMQYVSHVAVNYIITCTVYLHQVVTAVSN
jgi:hypothetical protein